MKDRDKNIVRLQPVLFALQTAVCSPWTPAEVSDALAVTWPLHQATVQARSEPRLQPPAWLPAAFSWSSSPPRSCRKPQEPQLSNYLDVGNAAVLPLLASLILMSVPRAHLHRRRRVCPTCMHASCKGCIWARCACVCSLHVLCYPCAARFTVATLDCMSLELAPSDRPSRHAAWWGEISAQ